MLSKGLRSKEHELALCGMNWDALTSVWHPEAVLAELQAALSEGAAVVGPVG
jgi:hypothetical protein